MKHKTYFLMPALIFILVSLFMSCEGDVATTGKDKYGSLDTAAIAVSVEWPGEVAKG